MLPSASNPVVIINDCALSALRKLRSNSVDCIITSPPYWMLRDYGIEPSDWPACKYRPMPGIPYVRVKAETSCLGLEPTLHAFIGHIVLIFEECRRVLKPTGSCWVNMGDAYAGSWGSQGREHSTVSVSAQRARQVAASARTKTKTGAIDKKSGLKPKDLMGQPWRIAFALQAAGWYLRGDNIWHKPNPMPESTRDRATKSHEYVFHLTKAQHYYFDITAWSEKVSGTSNMRRAADKSPAGWSTLDGHHGTIHPEGREAGPRAPGNIKPAKGEQAHKDGDERHRTKGGLLAYARKVAEAGSGIKANTSFCDAVTDLVTTRNKRTVWTVATVPYAGSHFATYPAALIAPPMLASTSAKGYCSMCGKPWQRLLERTEVEKDEKDFKNTQQHNAQDGPRYFMRDTGQWQATCKCASRFTDPIPVVPAIVLDICGGSGTTGEVALEHRRHAILIEVGSHNVELINKRLAPFLASPVLDLH